ncbi:ribonuclease 3 [Clostridium sp. CAG:710]|jgi:ribonuclease III|nr:ribonuclease 3 [Clostridium sp. CAG:710]
MKELFDRLNIKPKNLELYTTAFSHSSYVNENHIKSDYERLEFLGDAVLELVASDYLYKTKTINEGEMTKLRASYVCENACYEYSKDLNLSKYIKVGHGEEIDGGRYKKVILADIFEALMGAIYLDLGFSTAKRVIDSIVIPYVEDPNILFFSDYKSALQEYVQTKQKSLEYEVVLEQGPAHNKLFTTVVKIDGIIYGKGSAGSKKEAEQEAARDALKILAR